MFRAVISLTLDFSRSDQDARQVGNGNIFRVIAGVLDRYKALYFDSGYADSTVAFAKCPITLPKHT
jgi:hypothetical protein